MNLTKPLTIASNIRTTGSKWPVEGLRLAVLFAADQGSAGVPHSTQNLAPVIPVPQFVQSIAGK
jgi:hypothetical protein